MDIGVGSSVGVGVSMGVGVGVEVGVGMDVCVGPYRVRVRVKVRVRVRVRVRLGCILYCIAMCCLTWSDMYRMEDINILLYCFNENLLQVLNEIAYIRNYSNKLRFKSYISSETKDKMRIRYNLKKLSMGRDRRLNKDDYKKARNMVTKC